MASLVNSYVKGTLHKIFSKTEEEGTLLNSFNEASIIIIPKSNKEITRKETIGHYPIYRYILNKYTAYQI